MEEKGPAMFTCNMTELKAITGHESIVSPLQHALHTLGSVFVKSGEIFFWLCREVQESVLNHRE